MTTVTAAPRALTNQETDWVAGGTRTSPALVQPASQVPFTTISTQFCHPGTGCGWSTIGIFGGIF